MKLKFTREFTPCRDIAENSFASDRILRRNKTMNCSKMISFSVLAGFTLALSACGNANSTEAQLTQNNIGEVVPESASESVIGNWDIIKEASHIQFSALQEGESFTGGFEDFTGEIYFDPDALDAANIRIEIPLASVDAGSNDRNSTVPGKVWFSTKAFPVAVFETQTVNSNDAGYVADGTLTLKGTSQPVQLGFDLEIEGKQAVMTGQAEIDRTLWGVGAAPWDTDEYVSKTITIDVKVTATRR